MLRVVGRRAWAARLMGLAVVAAVTATAGLSAPTASAYTPRKCRDVYLSSTNIAGERIRVKHVGCRTARRVVAQYIRQDETSPALGWNCRVIFPRWARRCTDGGDGWIQFVSADIE